jgi:cysteine desulfurase
MQPYFTDTFGNPASAHRAGSKARQALENAREQIAHLLGAYADEVIFTSGATEANNLALFGLAGDPPGVILSSLLEHPCVIEPLQQLVRRGFEIRWLPSSSPSPRLCCLMLVNHETGAIQPVRELASQLPAETLFHCDAAQAVGKIPVHFHDLGVTSLTVSGHKFHAPKGIGLLLLKRGVKLSPLLWGGHQQQGLRPGTESPALAVGIATALELAQKRMRQSFETVRTLKQRFIEVLRTEAEPVVINGPLDESQASPYVANASFPGCRAELLLMKLDLAGVACSTGSACSSGSLLPSPVLKAMGVPDEVLLSAMRFSFNPLLTEADVVEAARRIVKAVKELRSNDCER